MTLRFINAALSAQPTIAIYTTRHAKQAPSSPNCKIGGRAVK